METAAIANTVNETKCIALVTCVKQCGISQAPVYAGVAYLKSFNDKSKRVENNSVQ
jgi:hypothetical protein